MNKARRATSDFPTMAVRRAAGILLVAAWGMDSQAAAQQADPVDIWKLPAFKPASGPYQ